MYNKMFALLLIASFGFFAASSHADWEWYRNDRGNYYARVQDGECSSGVTVYYFSDHRGKGWRIAFDKKKWVNLNWANPEDVMVEAVERFYSDYCGTENYNPDCPNGSRPASQMAGTCFRK